MDEKELLEKVKKEASDAVAAFKSDYQTIADKASEGLLTAKEAEAKFAEIEKKAQDNIDSAIKTLTDSQEETKEDLRKMSIELKAISEKETKMEVENKFDVEVKGWVESPEFKSWVDGGQKGASPELKYTITGGLRTGTVLITGQSNVVSDAFVPRKKHVRDLMSVIGTTQPNHTFDKITEWTPGADMVSENGDAPTFDIKTAESTVNVKRVAGIMDFSNNVMRSLPYLVKRIQTVAPEKLRNMEDFQILFGDGAGNNLAGLYPQATTFDLTGPAFLATAVASVATYSAGTKSLITFAAPHGLTNAFKITFAAATEATYNAAFQVNVKTDKTIIIDKAYVAEADTSAWTATTKHYLALSIDGAQEYDVLAAAAAFMAGSEYTLSAWVLNPATVAKIELLKGTTLEYVGKIERIGGTLNIGGVPVIELNSMPANKFFGGDFYAAAELLEYESISLRFIEDVSYAKANKVALYITEQIMLPVYNPFMFVKGDFDTAKTALETA